MPRSKLSDTDVVELIQAVQDGYNDRKIADHFGVTAATVCGYRKKHNLPPNRKKIHDSMPTKMAIVDAHPIRIRDNVIVQILLPFDLTMREALKVSRVIDSFR